jgi:hypothetical protein
VAVRTCASTEFGRIDAWDQFLCAPTSTLAKGPISHQLLTLLGHCSAVPVALQSKVAYCNGSGSTIECEYRLHAKGCPKSYGSIHGPCQRRQGMPLMPVEPGRRVKACPQSCCNSFLPLAVAVPVYVLLKSVCSGFPLSEVAVFVGTKSDLSDGRTCRAVHCCSTLGPHLSWCSLGPDSSLTVAY